MFGAPTLTNEGLGAQIKPVESRHVQWSPPIHVLNVGVRPCLNEQFHAESPVVRKGGVMERSLATVVERVARQLVLEQHVHHNILAIVTCHMERSAPKRIHSFRLRGEIISMYNNELNIKKKFRIHHI